MPIPDDPEAAPRAGGGTLACRLAEAGFSVVAFDAGPYWQPLEDFASDEAEQSKLYWTDERIVDGANPLQLGANNSGRGVGGRRRTLGGRRMSPELSWAGIALRLGLTVLAGLLTGYNRIEEGKAIGMRTTVLICLAASVAMIEVNLLLPMSGRTGSSFVMNDLMRFPLGILTGVGFIGAGAILRRGTLVVGVTTAATIWLTTVVGLCFGAGLIWLGAVATCLQLIMLWMPKWLEALPRHVTRANLILELDACAGDDADFYRRLRSAGLAILGAEVHLEPGIGQRRLALDVARKLGHDEPLPPPLVRELASLPGVLSVSWKG